MCSYTAASSWLDAYALHRCSAGAAAQSLQWGEVGEVGGAARLQGRHTVAGIGIMPKRLVLQALRVAFMGLMTQIAFMSADWAMLLGRLPFVPGYFQPQTHAAFHESRVPSSEVVATASRSGSDLDLVLELARGLTGTSEVTADSPLMDAGLDSLPAIEFVNQCLIYLVDIVSLQQVKGILMPMY